jgi:hypothetical protein
MKLYEIKFDFLNNPTKHLQPPTSPHTLPKKPRNFQALKTPPRSPHTLKFQKPQILGVAQ